MIVYIAGPMSGLPDNNYPAFDAAAERLKAEGHRVINPADTSRMVDQNRAFWYHTEATWLDYMVENMRRMKHATAIHFLPNWENSYGARIEALVAEKMSLKEIK